jgi:cytoskeletal protein RodZ
MLIFYNMSKNKQTPIGDINVEDLKGKATDLREIRLSMDLSLKDVFEKIRISETHLEALENGDYHRLPPAVYTKGFIKSYTNFLGTDSQPSLALYEKFLISQSRKANLHESEYETNTGVPKYNYRRLTWTVMACLAAFTAIIIVFVVNKPFKEDIRDQIIRPPRDIVTKQSAVPTPPTTPPVRPTASTPAQEVASSKQSIPEAPAEKGNLPEDSASDTRVTPAANPKASPTPYHLVIKANDLTWLRISEDGKTPFEALLKAGEKFERDSQKGFRIDIGNADGVQVIFQGNSLGKLGQPGQVVHLNLP